MCVGESPQIETAKYGNISPIPMHKNCVKILNKRAKRIHLFMSDIKVQVLGVLVE